MNRFARHHCKAAGCEGDLGHAFHAGGDAAADDDELFLGRMVVGRDPATGRRLQKKGRGTGFRIAILERALQALDVLVLAEGCVLNGMMPCCTAPRVIVNGEKASIPDPIRQPASL
jgi:hypothetical protein